MYVEKMEYTDTVRSGIRSEIFIPFLVKSDCFRLVRLEKHSSY